MWYVCYGTYVAECINCNKQLNNTSKNRMQKHKYEVNSNNFPKIYLVTNCRCPDLQIRKWKRNSPRCCHLRTEAMQRNRPLLIKVWRRHSFNVPLRIIEDSSFVKMIRGLRPSINLPSISRSSVRSVLFGSPKTKEKVKSTLGAIHIDGWQNCQIAKNVVGLLEVGGQYILLQAIDTTVTGQRAVVLPAIARYCHKLALEIFGSIISDNARNIIK